MRKPIRFRSTDGLRKYGRDRTPRPSSWYAKTLAKMDREKERVAQENADMDAEHKAWNLES